MNTSSSNPSCGDQGRLMFDGTLRLSDLPPMAQDILKWVEIEDSLEIATLALLAMHSCLFDNVKIRKKKGYVKLNTYIMAVAESGTGKGIAEYFFNLLKPLHDELSTTKAQEILIQGNQTEAGLRSILVDNNGRPVVLAETEMSNLTGSLNSRFGGNMRTLLLKAIQGEMVGAGRKGEGQKVTRNPFLSIFMTGTLSHPGGILDGNKDGMHSRFLYYIDNREFVLKEPMSLDDDDDELPSLGEVCEEAGELWLEHSRKYRGKEIKVRFNREAKQKINEEMHRLEKEYLKDPAKKIPAGFITRATEAIIRLGGNFALMRCCHDNKEVAEDVCVVEGIEQDVETAISIVRHSIKDSITLLESSSRMHRSGGRKISPTTKAERIQELKEQALSNLEGTFTYNDVVTALKKLDVGKSSAYTYVREMVDDGMILKEGKSLYRQASEEKIPEVQDSSFPTHTFFNAADFNPEKAQKIAEDVVDYEEARERMPSSADDSWSLGSGSFRSFHSN